MKEKPTRPVSTHRKDRVKSADAQAIAKKKQAPLTGKPKQVNKMQESGFTELKLWFPDNTLQNLKQLLEEMGYPAAKPDKSGNEKRNLQSTVDAISYLIAANVKKPSAANAIWSKAQTASEQQLVRTHEVVRHRKTKHGEKNSEIIKFLNEKGYPVPEIILSENKSGTQPWKAVHLVRLSTAIRDIKAKP